jgi:hypothetical protein
LLRNEENPHVLSTAQIFFEANSATKEPEGSSPHSQQLAIGPYPEPIESNPHTATNLLKSILIATCPALKTTVKINVRLYTKRFFNFGSFVTHKNIFFLNVQNRYFAYNSITFLSEFIPLFLKKYFCGTQY